MVVGVDSNALQRRVPLSWAEVEVALSRLRLAITLEPHFLKCQR
jgi:hypothetical protein